MHVLHIKWQFRRWIISLLLVVFEFLFDHGSNSGSAEFGRKGIKYLWMAAPHSTSNSELVWWSVASKRAAWWFSSLCRCLTVHGGVGFCRCLTVHGGVAVCIGALPSRNPDSILTLMCGAWTFSPWQCGFLLFPPAAQGCASRPIAHCELLLGVGKWQMNQRGIETKITCFLLPCQKTPHTQQRYYKWEDLSGCI